MEKEDLIKELQKYNNKPWWEKSGRPLTASINNDEDPEKVINNWRSQRRYLTNKRYEQDWRDINNLLHNYFDIEKKVKERGLPKLGELAARAEKQANRYGYVPDKRDEGVLYFKDGELITTIPHHEPSSHTLRKIKRQLDKAEKRFEAELRAS